MSRMSFDKRNKFRTGSKTVHHDIFGELPPEKRGIVTKEQRDNIKFIEETMLLRFTGSSWGDADRFIRDAQTALKGKYGIVDPTQPSTNLPAIIPAHSLPVVSRYSAPCCRRDCDNTMTEGDEVLRTKYGDHCSDYCLMKTVEEVMGLTFITLGPNVKRPEEYQDDVVMYQAIEDNEDLGIVPKRKNHKSKSGIPWVYPYGERWQVRYKKKHIGIATTTDEAEEMLKKYKIDNGLPL
ncbi:hypothetical protein D3C74_50170 [compost metagenome]